MEHSLTLLENPKSEEETNGTRNDSEPQTNWGDGIS